MFQRFLNAGTVEESAMPRSIQLEYMHDACVPLPSQCLYPTLRDVAISRKVLPRYADESLKFDVYHFRNHRTKEELTIALVKSDDLELPEEHVVYVFLQKGHILASEEDIAEMPHFPYQLSG